MRPTRTRLRTREFKSIALLALLAACNAEAPATSAASPSPDTAGSDVASADAPAGDTAPIDAREPNDSLITPDGWGPLRIGMSRADVVAAAGEDANPDAVGGPDPEQCDEFRPAGAPAGILVMIEQGVLTRISVNRNPDIRTPEGFGVGDAGADVVAAYGARAQVEPHQYSEAPAKYITVWRDDAAAADRRGIRYEVNSTGNVMHVRAGGPAIEYVEGCV